ncbi:histidinol-phosphatase HisJ [Alkalihalobacillus pseudalcaliphilus]|uniref:histidinol-phosphatase HisJ n=1 Tax=Alkalihalobacillus pseudalcaliphilus TaxID=79884 RepID=UPI00064D7651|nr:histidinol-phosphatase HisJ [Alkalihalobacillus pseudalcaliphilus]KMK77836.1 histidinol phosphatase [Alkalihalobacillus pseudalcaliphilus]
MIVFDGHVHTPFCPHGTKDPLEAYCENAIHHGLTAISFMEHAPLPHNFHDPVPHQDSALSWNDLELYLLEVEKVKRAFQGSLTIYTGLEVDYIEGYEKETTKMLDTYGPSLDDSILSVHFLNFAGQYICLDYSPQSFQKLVERVGSIENVHDLYFQTVEKSILTPLGAYKPKRIGHITLSTKFQKRFPTTYLFDSKLDTIFKQMYEQSLALDINGAGVLKPLCGETYPNPRFITRAHQYQIPLIYGSDAHQVKAMMSGIEQLPTTIDFVTHLDR